MAAGMNASWNRLSARPCGRVQQDHQHTNPSEAQHRRANSFEPVALSAVQSAFPRRPSSWARAASTTRSGVNPKRLWTSLSGADLPNVCMAMISPMPASARGTAGTGRCTQCETTLRCAGNAACGRQAGRGARRSWRRASSASSTSVSICLPGTPIITTTKRLHTSGRLLPS